jgi:hypothetical protein
MALLQPLTTVARGQPDGRFCSLIEEIIVRYDPCPDTAAVERRSQPCLERAVSAFNAFSCLPGPLAIQKALGAIVVGLRHHLAMHGDVDWQ